MNNKQAVDVFISLYKNILVEHNDDYCYKQTLWEIYKTGLHKGGFITNKQYATWDNPECCKKDYKYF